MKRVYLWKPGEPVVHMPTLRAAAVSLATLAVDGENGRRVGDPIHEWVTEGRRQEYEWAVRNGSKWALNMEPYSSCGDLAHWLLTMLGCRDESVVNRTDDGGVMDWMPGPNISRLVGSKFYTKGHRVNPMLGDIIHVSSPHHVAVLIEKKSEDKWFTADYGQPYGQRKPCDIGFSRNIKYIRGRPLQGFVSLSKMVNSGAFTESAVVPDDFELGVPCDNPHNESNLWIPT
jgi:hypothetical protein